MKAALRAVVVSMMLVAPMSSDADQSAEPDRAARSSTVRASEGRALVLRERRTYYGPLIEEAARRQGLRVDLVHAIIEVESAYRPDAVSRAGAVGLMQLMPKTARRYGVDDSTDPRQNLAGGTAYLRDLDALYGGDLRLVLAAYNAGEEAVARYGTRVPPYAETRDYVRRVLQLLRQSSPMLVNFAEAAPTSARSPEGDPAWTR